MELHRLSKLTQLYIIILFLASCKDSDKISPADPSVIETKVETGPVLDRIIELGFGIGDVKDYGDYYLVEDDIIFPKYKHPHGRIEQAYTHNLVDKGRQEGISVHIDNSIPTGGNDNWRPQITQALNDWSTMNDLMISFVETGNNADITILADGGELPPNAIAVAEFPSNRIAGEQILINLDFGGFWTLEGEWIPDNWNVPVAVRRRNVVHELGHCIGFRHTNWQGRGEAAEPIGANTVAGTNGNDPNSVMNGGTALDPWIGFSNDDILSAVFLYPEIEDQYLWGDWNDDGMDNMAIRRGNQILMETNFDGNYDIVHFFGNGDLEDEYLAGDFNGDGQDDIAVRRNNEILSDTDRNGYVDYTQNFGNGNSEDQYLVGDFNGDGRDEVAVRRGNEILSDTDMNGYVDFTQYFGNGNSEDQYLTGDWNNDGRDEVAIRRGNEILSDTDLNGYVDYTQYFGNGSSEDEYAAADWNGDGQDDVTIRRNNEALSDTDINGYVDFTQSFGYGTDAPLT